MALLRHDVGRGALLLERLGPVAARTGVPVARRHEILCATAQRVWRPVPGPASACRRARRRPAGWPTWIATAWEELERPCSAAAVDDALACAERRARAHDPARAVLVHGDVHQWNALAAGEGYKLVDPDGLEAEPEYDLGIIMREDPLELLDGDPIGARRPAGRPAPASTRRRSGSGAWSSGSRPGCSGPRWACSPWRARCCARRIGWRVSRRLDGSPPAAPASRSSACAARGPTTESCRVDAPITGHCDARFAAVRDEFARNFAERGEVGAAVCVIVDGTTVVDLAGGWTDAARRTPWRHDTLVNFYSVGKAFVGAPGAAAGRRRADRARRPRRRGVARVRRRAARRRRRCATRCATAPACRPSASR